MWLLLAFLSAVAFGLRGIMYQRTSKKPLDRNLMLFGVYVTGVVVSVAAIMIVRPEWSYANLIGIAMGVLSYIANASMYKGYAEGKASLVAILTALSPLIVVSGAYFMFAEKLSLPQSAAFFVILAGIVMIRYSNDLSLKNLQGVQWALMATVMFGFNDLFSKLAVYLQGEVFPTLFYMFIVGSLLFLLTWLRERRAGIFLGERWSIRKTVGWGMLVGITNISGMVLLLYAFASGVTGLVSAASATNVLIIIFYARIFLKEKFKPMEIAGIACAFIGIMLLRLFA
ncbi:MULTISPECIES: DMT family transporter [unclassified Paenibacillus]|uniref:DMT family transporter n=1 Tax=unclassified Paenibacillus TaxID=185978 RepID=UPI001C1006B1|nr:MULTISPECIES: DMT family transporter [unclassified Paenibacillus]MBU5444392.1 DMT family transporter [Paenibacillus sp. MSJ-34]CAH0120181.1 hypothetical protein PAE9249_02694 [Paenibacillus sp. CECT 9249]